MTEGSIERLTLQTAGVHLTLVFHDRAVECVPTVRKLWAESIASPVDNPDITMSVIAAGAVPDAAQSTDATFTIDLDNAEAFYRLSGEITTSLLRHLVGKRLLFHAGAVILPGIGLVLLTGASGAGKSTLTTALAHSGLYITDEMTTLDPVTFEAELFAKPISVVQERESSQRRIKMDIPLADLRIAVADSASLGSPAHLILVNRDKNAQHAQLRPLGLLEAIVTLAGQSSSIWALEQPLRTLVRFLESLEGAWEATYGEARTLESAFREAVASRDHGGVSPVEAADYEIIEPGSVRIDVPGSDQYALGPFYEAVWCGGSIAVLTAGEAPKLVRLEGLGAVVWEVLANTGALLADELRQELERVAGPHPDSKTLMNDALDLMIKERVLVRGGGVQ